MTLIQKIRLSERYGVHFYVISALFSIAAAIVCFFYPVAIPVCMTMKLLCIPVILYLCESFQNKHAIYFYLNLGISKIEYYLIPVVTEFSFFIALITISCCIGNVVR